MAVRRKRVDAAFRDRALHHRGSPAIAVDTDTDGDAWTTTLHLADQFGLTLYDAAYLELAQRRGAPLACLDRRSRHAAHASGLSILGDAPAP